MSRYYAQDIRDYIIDILENGSSELDSLEEMIAIIDGERAQDTPSPLYIGYGWGRNQYPAVHVEVEGSETEVDESEIRMTYDRTVEIYTVFVMVLIRDNTDNLYNYVENYCEAFSRIFHGDNNENITWIAKTSEEKSEVYTRQNQTFKSALVEFEVRIN